VAAAVLQLIKLPGFDTVSKFDFDDPYSRWAPCVKAHPSDVQTYKTMRCCSSA
jgi:hypothetical protein